jgi:hypothetical protein
MNVGSASDPIRFVDAAVTSSSASCPIDYSLTTVSPSTGLSVQYDSGSGELWVIPTDKSIHKVYTFAVTYTAEGGKTWTSPSRTLDVGCINAVITDNSGFTSSVDVYFGASTSNVYTFLNPTVSLSYCAVELNNLVEIKFDNIADSSQAFFSVGCTEPCTSINIKSTATTGKITFKVQSVITGNFAKLSPRVTINIICAPGTTFTPSFSSGTIFNIALNTADPNWRHTFSSFTCSEP